MRERLGRLVDADEFQYGILAVIVLAALLVGLETSRALVARHGSLLHVLDILVLWIFVAEAVLKMARHGRRWYRYFGDAWNIFDFLRFAAVDMAENVIYFLLGQGLGLTGRTDEIGNPRNTGHLVPGLLGHFHLYQHVTGQEAPFGYGFFAAAHLDHFFHRHYYLGDSTTGILRFYQRLEQGFHLVLMPRIRMQRVP